jgi:hypothetical protein
MDNKQEAMIDGVRVTTELEAEDSLAVLMKRVRFEGLAPRGSLRPVLEKQARSIVEKVTYLDGELSLIEVDGVSNAVQIRSKKPTRPAPDADARFVEVVLRGGNTIDVEARGGALHVSRENYNRLLKDLSGLL